jgi:hypothetical protein
MSLNLKYLLNVSPTYLLATALVPLALSAAEPDLLDSTAFEAVSQSTFEVAKKISNEQFDQLIMALVSGPNESRLDAIQEIRTFANGNPEDPNGYILMGLINEFKPLWERIEDLEFYKRIARTPNHQKQIDALETLWFYGNSTESASAYSTLQDLAKEEGSIGDEAALELFTELNRYDVRNSVYERILKIATDASNPNANSAAIALWKDRKEASKNHVRHRMFSLVQPSMSDGTPENLIDWTFAQKTFLGYCLPDNQEDMNFIRNLTLNTEHPLYLDSLKCLGIMWPYSDINAQYRAAANDTLSRFYNNNPNHQKAHDIAIHLAQNGTDEQKDQARTFLRNVLNTDLDDQKCHDILTAHFLNCRWIKFYFLATTENNYGYECY